MHKIGMTEREWKPFYKDQVLFRAMREFLIAPSILIELDKTIYWSPKQGKAAIYGEDGYQSDAWVLLSESQKNEMVENGFMIELPR